MKNYGEWVDNVKGYDDGHRPYRLAEMLSDWHADSLHRLEEEERLREEVKALKALVKAQCWIPVTERLPEDYTDVLVIWHWRDSDKLIYSITRKWNNETKLYLHDLCDDDGSENAIITCWCLLPNPPKEAK